MAKNMSVAQDVCSTCVHIAYTPFSVDILLSPHLETLKIRGAVVHGGLLTLLSRIAPKLKTLTLSSCILNPICPQHYRIIMPHTDFSTLFIVSKQFIWERHYDTLEDTDEEVEERAEGLENMDSKISIKKHQMVSLKIARISSNQVQYYTLTPGNPPVIKVVSKDDYTKRTIGWPHIYIECKSLQNLNIDLGTLVVELKPDCEKPIESIGN